MRGKAREERPGARGESAARDRARGHGQARMRGAQAEPPLEQQGREEQARVERESVERRRDQRAGEPPVAQHREVHGRRAGLALADHEERGEQARRDEEDRVVAAAELERDDRAGKEARTAEVERLAPLGVRELEMAADEPEAEKPERRVDEEDRRPPELVGEESPQRRSEQGSQDRRESD